MIAPVSAPRHPCYRREPTAAQQQCLSHYLGNGANLLNGVDLGTGESTYWWARSIVFEYLARRDGGVCGICGGPVNRKLRSGRWKASLDHITSRADGGEDTFDNIQLAHLGCNSSKGAWSYADVHPEAAWKKDIEELPL